MARHLKTLAGVVTALGLGSASRVRDGAIPRIFAAVAAPAMVAFLCSGCATPRDVAVPMIVVGAAMAALAPAGAAIVSAETGYPMGDAVVIAEAPAAMLLAAGFILLQLTESASTAAPLHAKDYLP